MVPDSNPFAPPTARVDDIPLGSRVLAGRGARLGAVLVDGLIQGAVYFALAYTLFPSLKPSAATGADVFGRLLASLALGMVLFALIQGTLLYRHGQTIGKRLVGIRIVRSNGDDVAFGRLLGLRYFLEAAITAIPIVGFIFALVDSLLIFRESRRCLHDNIADTLVIKA